MFRNYLLTAWRNILKNKVYAGINIACLVIGLSVYLFGSMLADSERNFDTFWGNHDRIFTLGTAFAPDVPVGVKEVDGTYSAIAPLVTTDVSEIDHIARVIRREFLITLGNDDYYQQIRFVDPAFTDIFQLNYLMGDGASLQDPSAVMLTKSAAEKYFPDGDPIGKTITLDHKLDLRVTAVFEDLPINTHLTSSLLTDGGFEVVAGLGALAQASNFEIEGGWDNLSSGDLTYVVLPDGQSVEWLQNTMNDIFEAHLPADDREIFDGIKVRPLKEANTVVWDMIGLPMIESVQLLAMLVLIVAIVNYTNLATAQSLSRSKEVGLRKTMGASRQQLLSQFLVESITISAISMLLALAALEAVIPAFNNAAGRIMSIDYFGLMPWLVATTLLVGTIAGVYPAYIITQATPIQALRGGANKGAKGGTFRSVMLGLQFTISIFMLGMVMVFFLQNQRIESSGSIYPKSQIYTLDRLSISDIASKQEALRNELLRIDNVEGVTFSSQVPFEQSYSGFTAGANRGDEAGGFTTMQVAVGDDFFTTYQIPLLAGRFHDAEISRDMVTADSTEANVVINDLMAETLGFGSPANALGKQFYDFPTDRGSDTRASRVYTIVGIVSAQNFQGFHNGIKPTAFVMREADSLRIASVRMKAAGILATVKEVETVWNRVIPDYPMQGQYLDAFFDDVFQIFRAISQVMAGFAFLALTLSLIGLFGLAAFMAANRTKEIGIRKVMGANVSQIVRLLIWQFSKPVVWALLVALPLTYVASGIYLDFFADRIPLPELLILAAGVISILFAWSVVAFHAIRVARSNPIFALRYE